MAQRVSVLGAGDEARLLSFLERHPDTTMFLRGNLRRAGIVDRGQRFGGTYVAAFEDDAVVGAAAHFWNGNLVVEAPDGLDAIARCAVSSTGRAVNGVLGPWDQTQRVLAVLTLDVATASLATRDGLFALPLCDLRVPALLERAEVACRRPRSDELDRLASWQTAYHIEILGARDGPELRERVRASLLEMNEAGTHWVLEVDGAPVAYSAFNAVLPDCVQVGGVYTPPELRGRGYARAVVAGSLLDARAGGASRSVLFTGDENRAAQTAYRALGYRRTGDWGLILFS